MGSILTVVKLSLYIVDFNNFIILSVTVCVIQSTLDLTHVLYISYSQLQGGGEHFPSNTPPPPLFAPPRVFSSTQAFYFSMLHYILWSNSI